MKTKPIIQKVIFRAERRKDPEVSAVLVGQAGSYTAPLTVWDSQGGHCIATWDWYYRSRPAKPAEYQRELAALRRQYAPEYEIRVVRKYTRRDGNILRQQLNRS